MSRSNTHYYNLCSGWNRVLGSREVGDDGYCDYHRPGRYWPGRGSKCIPDREYETRRGMFRRKRRFPKWAIGSWHSTPPADVKKGWKRRLRAMYRAELVRRPDDPELFDGEKAHSKLLWEWY